VVSSSIHIPKLESQVESDGCISQQVVRSTQVSLDGLQDEADVAHEEYHVQSIMFDLFTCSATFQAKSHITSPFDNTNCLFSSHVLLSNVSHGLSSQGNVALVLGQVQSEHPIVQETSLVFQANI
jgi:hypothetical protein